MRTSSKISHSNLDGRSVDGDLNADIIKISHSNLDGRSVEGDLNVDFIKFSHSYFNDLFAENDLNHDSLIASQSISFPWVSITIYTYAVDNLDITYKTSHIKHHTS